AARGLGARQRRDGEAVDRSVPRRRVELPRRGAGRAEPVHRRVGAVAGDRTAVRGDGRAVSRAGRWLDREAGAGARGGPVAGAVARGAVGARQRSMRYGPRMSLDECLPAHLRGPSTTFTRVAAGLSGAGVYRVDAGGASFLLKVSAADEAPDGWRRRLEVQR